MANFVVYTDQGPGSNGTGLAAVNLNTAVPATPYLISGGVLTGFSGSSLAISFPATAAVVPNGAGAPAIVEVALASAPYTLSANSDVYFDLSWSGSSNTGTLTLVTVGNNVTPANPASNALRLCKVVTNGSGVVSATQIAPGMPVDDSQVAADQVEASTNDPLGATSTITTSLNRIRYQLGQIMGGPWNAAVQMIPLSQKGAPNGVAPLDSNTLVATTSLHTGSGANKVLVTDGNGNSTLQGHIRKNTNAVFAPTLSLLSGGIIGLGLVTINSLVSDDTRGYIIFTTTATITGPVDLAQLTYGTAYLAQPVVTLSDTPATYLGANTPVGPAGSWYASEPTLAHFKISVSGTIAANKTYCVAYHVLS